MASSYYTGVLDGTLGWRKGRKSGGSYSRQLLSWRAPISSIPKLALTGLKMKSPDVNPGDQVIRDRRNKDIAKNEGRWSFPSWPEDEAREIVHLNIQKAMCHRLLEPGDSTLEHTEGRWSFPSWPEDKAREIVHLNIQKVSQGTKQG